ncbi:MAG: pentapeptide repeat-containing protein [Cyanobacteria bacterium P01_C01_bin.89]
MTRVALVVGINTYTHFRDLSAPAHDGEAIAQLLQQSGDFDTVTRLPERIIAQGDGTRNPAIGETLPVSRADLKAALKQLFDPDGDRSQLPDTALFYFSGHGLPDREGFDKGYLVTSDTDPNDPQMAISFGWLYWLLSESPIPRQIVWLDCCHSGGLLIKLDTANPGYRQDHSRCFIASSRDFEDSWQDLNSDYSVLTKALLEGLDPNRRPGRWVDTFALVNHVNQALKGKLQTPICTNFGSAINLTRTWQTEVEQPEEVPTDGGVCPYKGLDFFDLNDEDPKYFFGREGFVNQLLDQVRQGNFMALVGASGSGKSSVLRAGLLHQLRLGRLTGSNQWQILIMRPDDHPMENLAAALVPGDRSREEVRQTLEKEGGAALARLVEGDSSPRVMLVIDQFEEVFTLCEDGAERSQFFACLMGALQATGDSQKLGLAIAMRSDFVGRCLEHRYSGLAQRVQGGMVSMLPMEPDELRDAICQPAMGVGLTVEEALVTEILQDIQGAPGSLPLLQYALKELWQRRRKGELVLSAYQDLGGITGTLDRRATELYTSFDESQQRTVRHIFQQLTQLGEGAEDTRRRVFLDNLVSEPLHSAERVKTIVETLADKDNRLLVTSSDDRGAIVDVAHEALIRHWKLLRQWVGENRDLLRQQRRIEGSAASWQNNKNYWLEGWALKEAIRFQKQQADTFPLSEPAKEFIAKSKGRRRRKQIKTASWLIIPAIAIVGIIEYDIRERQVEANIALIETSENGLVRTNTIENLVVGCGRWVPTQKQNWLGNYIGERVLFGNCRSLKGVNLSGANFTGAKLIGADLREADLKDTDLEGVDLSRANLSKAKLWRATLWYAKFNSANLSRAELRGADLSYAQFHNATLVGASLIPIRSIQTSGTIEKTRYLKTTYLSEVELWNADLREVKFGKTTLSDSTLLNADLSGANLNYIDIRSSVLVGTNLRNAKLTVEQLTGTARPYLCNVVLPETLEESGINPNEDCATLDELMEEEYYWGLTDEEQRDFRKVVEEAKQKQWD